MDGDEARVDTEMIEQMTRMPGVFGRDHVDRAQHIERPEREIPQITDGSGHHI